MRPPRSLSSLAACAALAAAACGGVGLEHGLDEPQANEVVAALERAGVGAEKSGDDSDGRWKVTVARGALARAVEVLAARSLPRRGERARAAGGGGLLPSAAGERARREAVLEGELERTLEGLAGVAAARVHLALPVDDPLRGDLSHPRSTASVLLRTTGPHAISETEVRKLVAGAVEGLDAADVTLAVAPAPADAPPELATVGPLEVAAASRGAAVALLTVGLLAILALSTIVVLGALRVAALRRRLEALERARPTT